MDNLSGKRRISESPVSLCPDGIYNDVEYIDVELRGEGKIYYSCDGSLPDSHSTEYTKPIRVDKSSVIRAVAIKDGEMPSRPLNLSFILNENHSLPVVSLVTDNPPQMRHLYISGSKDYETPGNVSYYGEDRSFSAGCGISITGHDSLRLPKKSLALNFRGAYGEDKLNYDVFGTGTSQYSSLALRAGQDNDRLVFRQEIWQDLCFDMTDKLPNQHSKFCIVYLNGEYLGIHCLKERLDKSFYAQYTGSNKNAIESVNMMGLKNPHFLEEVFNFCRENDMSLDENYLQLCEKLDIDSFIDWFIVQGVCGNMDLFQNVIFMKAEGGKWQPVLFDLDHSMMNDYLQKNQAHRFEPRANQQFAAFFEQTEWSSSATGKLLKNLFKNESFIDSLLSRYGQVYNTALSNPKILERIEYYEALLSPELERDWQHWNRNPALWRDYVEHTKALITDSDWQYSGKESLYFYLSNSGINISREKFESYFD